MNEKMRTSPLLIIAVLAGLIFQSEAWAGVQFAAQGALDINSSNYGFASSPNLLLGAQLTMDISYPYQVGIAYENNSLSYNNGAGSGTLKFYGLVGRIRTISAFYFDGQIGLDNRDSVGSSFSWGVGSGYSVPLSSSIEIAPRLGYRFLPDSGYERSMIDVGAQMIFKFN
jgi:hypothetical protein